MPGLPKDGTSKGKRTIARKRLPDELAQDPTSIFFAASIEKDRRKLENVCVEDPFQRRLLAQKMDQEEY